MRIKLPDYARIYKTIRSVILREGGNIEGACTFFSFYGAHLLKQHYKIDAIPMAGLCFYHLGGDNNVLSFGRMEGESFTSDVDAFHCWIICDGWLIDFMAPEFGVLTSSRGITTVPKMMQKPLTHMAKSVNEISQEGDFYFEPNFELLEERKRYMSSKMAYSDLENVCASWYKKPPKRMLNPLKIGDEKGRIKDLKLEGKSLVGAW